MLRRNTVLILAVLGIAMQATGNDKAWRKVQEAYAKGRPYKAVRACDRMLSGPAPDQRFLVLRAVGRNMLGHHEKALHDAAKGTAHVRGDTLDLARVQVGIALVALGHADSARHWFALAFDGAHAAEARRRMAGLHKTAGRCAEAIALLDQVLIAGPDDQAALRERGGCHAMQGDTAAARADLDRAIELAPRDPVAWNGRGQDLHARAGRWGEALADFQRAIKLDPNYSFAFNNMGLALHKLGRTDKGLRAIALAGRKKPDNPFVPRNLGLIALDRGDTARACAHFQRALAMGFTDLYGTELVDLVRSHCTVVAPPSTPSAPSSPPGTPAPINAPGRHNAP